MPDILAEPLEDTQELRRQLLETCFDLRDRLGYFVSTWGNVSVRIKEGMLLTPSRLEYDEMDLDDFVVVSMAGEKVSGHRVPTSETEMHRQIMLERPDIGALIHSHSTWASVCACAHRSIPVLVDDMAEVIGGEVNCTDYVQAGHHLELAAGVRKTIGPDANALLLGNHGVICGGRTLNEARVCNIFVEKAAQILIHAEALGGVKPIPESCWREEHHRYLHKYGKAEDLTEVLEK